MFQNTMAPYHPGSSGQPKEKCKSSLESLILLCQQKIYQVHSRVILQARTFEDRVEQPRGSQGIGSGTTILRSVNSSEGCGSLPKVLNPERANTLQIGLIPCRSDEIPGMTQVAILPGRPLLASLSAGKVKSGGFQ